MSNLPRFNVNILFITGLAACLVFVPGCKSKEKANENQGAAVEKGLSQEGSSVVSAEDLSVTVIPQNGQRIRDRNMPIRVYFSTAVNPDDFTFELSPEAGEWTETWAMANRTITLEHSSPFEIGKEYNAEIEVDIAGEKNLEQSVRFIVTGPTSLELIDGAEERGEIDIDTAWTLRLQSLFTPRQLPAAYKSSAVSPCGTPAMRRFQSVKKELKPETLESLRPYLLRPTDPDSVFEDLVTHAVGKEEIDQKNTSAFSLIPAAFAGQKEKRPPEGERFRQWFMLRSSIYPIKVWSPYSWRKARIALADIEGTAMFYSFSNLLGREPLSDGNEPPPHNGGDGLLDIYLVPPDKAEREEGVQGYCVNTQSGTTSPAWIMVDYALTGRDLEATLAHELFHAFQFAFDQWEEEWWTEGTAVWAEDYAIPNNNREHDFIKDAYMHQFNRLETLTHDGGLHPYGIYLFPFHLSFSIGDQKITDIWKACENQGALNAADMNLPDGLDECFKEFALHQSDIGSYKGKYDDFGGPLKLYKEHGEKEVELKSEDVVGTAPGKEEMEVNIDLPPLSARFFRITNKADKELTPHILFDLEDFLRNDKLTIQVIIEPEGKALEEDWSSLEKREFCINIDEEYFKDIALIVASAERESVTFPQLRILMDREGCLEGDAIVTVSRRMTETFARDTSGGNKTEWTNWKRVIDTTVKATFELGKSAYEPNRNPPEIREFYKLKSWHITSGRAFYSLNAFYELRGEEYHQGIETRRSSSERTNGKVKQDPDEVEPEEMSPLRIYLDAESRKAKEVRIPIFSTDIDWTGIQKEFSVRGNAGWDPYARRFTRSVYSNYSLDIKSEGGFGVGTIRGSSGEGYKVTGGDGEKSLEGGASDRESLYDGHRRDISVRWSIKRNKPKGK